MNHCTLIGNLTKDVERTETPSGVAVAKFSIAVNRNYKSADGERIADYFNIVAWRGLADTCAKFLSKGKKAAVSGEIQNRSYEDKDGNKRYVTEIIASDVEFLSLNTSNEQQETEQAPVTRPPKVETLPYQTQLRGLAKKPELIPIDDDDSLPF